MLKLLSFLVIVVNAYVIYIWIVDWEFLFTGLGLISWAFVITAGIILFKVFKKRADSAKSAVTLKFLIGGVTGFSILLVVVSVLIEIATSSMP